MNNCHNCFCCVRKARFRENPTSRMKRTSLNGFYFHTFLIRFRFSYYFLPFGAYLRFVRARKCRRVQIENVSGERPRTGAGVLARHGKKRISKHEWDFIVLSFRVMPLTGSQDIPKKRLGRVPCIFYFNFLSDPSNSGEQVHVITPTELRV